MDARSVGVLFDAGLLESKNTARVPYEDYLGVVRMIASEAKVSLHEVYRALYAYAELGELAAEDTSATVDGTESATTAPAEGRPGETTSATAKKTTAQKSTTTKAAPKKAAAKKATGKKSTAKKTTAKKSTAQKPNRN